MFPFFKEELKYLRPNSQFFPALLFEQAQAYSPFEVEKQLALFLHGFDKQPLTFKEKYFSVDHKVPPAINVGERITHYKLKENCQLRM